MSTVIRRWEPFGSFFPALAPASAARTWSPATDLVETGDAYVLRADLPGLTHDDVDLSFERNVLTLSGERHAQRDDERDGVRRVERLSGSFRRSLRLPEGVDASAITARFEHGVLEVTVPKPAAQTAHKVQIEVGGVEDRAAEQAATS